MISTLGSILVVLALCLAVGGAVTSVAGARLRRPVLVHAGRGAALTVFAVVAAMVALMIVALVTHDFSVKYVAEVGSRETPLFYTVISLWGALEGSILFWAFLLSGYTVVFLLAYRHQLTALQPYITGILLAISSFFLFVIAGPSNPFLRVNPAPHDGPGPNPLLQNNPMMGLHPPLLYLGYVGLAVPYAIAMASLVVGEPGVDVLRLIRRWALIPWVFLSLGIIGGMWWSYAVLGWGGYWSWDPVENASLMPWLVTTAFLHSLQVQERRRMLKTWTIALIIAAFLLSMLGTFLTRSGVLESVHSFTQSDIGPLFLGFLTVVLLLSLGLLLVRSTDLGAPGTFQAVICRETAFLFNNLLLVAVTFTILFGTLFPLIAEALQGTQLSVGAPYFNHLAVPIGLSLLFLMGVGPALPWGAARLEDLQWRFLGPVAAGAGVILALLALGLRGSGALLTFGLAAFVLAVTAARVFADVRVRHGNTAESWSGAAWRLSRANPRRYGGYLIHLGVLLVVIGVAGSQVYQMHASATLRAGQSLRLAGYRATYLGFHSQGQPNRMVLEAGLDLRRSGRDLGVLAPSQNIYPTLEQPVVTPAIREEPWDMLYGLGRGQSPLPDLAPLLHGDNPFEDVYIVLQAINVQTVHGQHLVRSVTIQMLVNPLVGFIWLGGIVVGLGGMFALLPARRRAAPVRQETGLGNAVKTPEGASA